MPFQFTKDRKTVLVANGGVTVSPSATTFGVAGTAVADFPTGPRVFEVQATGESILVTAGFGTTTWSGITRGVNGTTAATILDSSVLLEIIGADELASFVQQGDAALTNVRSIKKTGSAALTGDVTLTGGTNVTLTQSGQDITIAATSGGSVTSVALSLPGIFTVSGSPVTGSGTLTAVLTSESANTVLAGPTTGSSAAPTFRTLVAADVTTVNPSALTGSGTVPLAALSGITTAQLSGSAAILGSQLAAAAAIAAAQIASVNPSALTGSGTVPLAGLSGITSVQVSTVANGVTPLNSQALVPASFLPVGSANIDPTAVEGDVIYRHVPTTVTIGFIGDSITANTPSGGSTPPANTVADLTTITATASNQAVSGTNSNDWVPGQANYITAKAAFISAGVSVVHVMIGTNDSSTLHRTTQATYKSNLASLCADLNAAGMICVLSYPSYAVPGSIGGTFDATSDTLLQQYGTAIDQLVNGTTIRQGDTTAYTYFQAHTSELSDGIHPTATGSVHFGTFWSAALKPIVTCPLKRLPVGGAGTYVRSNGTDPAYSAILAGDLPLATTGAFGAVKPDGTSITISAGVISASGGSATHSESLTDGASNFIFAKGDIVTVVGVPN